MSYLVPTLVPFPVIHDSRGSFQKVFPFQGESPISSIREIFWSRSSKGVVRGMHFQPRNFGGIKVVFVIQGAIADYCVNLEGRGCEPGSIFFNEMREGESLVVPKGFAHGFQALEQNTLVGYVTDHLYAPTRESGFNPLSHPVISWPLRVSEISERDSLLPRFDEV